MPLDTSLDFRTTSLADLAHAVRTKEVSARELTQAALDRIAKHNPTYNAFVAVDTERALTDAAALDESIAAGHDPGPLAGIPLGVKDNQDAIGFVTTNGSPLHADDAPAKGLSGQSCSCAGSGGAAGGVGVGAGSTAGAGGGH